MQSWDTEKISTNIMYSVYNHGAIFIILTMFASDFGNFCPHFSLPFPLPRLSRLCLRLVGGVVTRWPLMERLIHLIVHSPYMYCTHVHAYSPKRLELHITQA